MSQDQLTIRINLNKETPATIPTAEPSWHVKRICLFLLVVGLLIFALYRVLLVNSPVSEAVLPPLVSENPTSLKLPASPQQTAPAAPQQLAALPAKSQILPPSTTLTSTRLGKPAELTMSRVIKRALLSRDIQHNEPRQPIHGSLSLHDLPDHSVYLFSEIESAVGQTIHHRWFYKNQLMMDIPHTLEAKRWRSFSRKTFNKKLLGEWRVEITDQHDTLLWQLRFNLKA